MSTAAYSGNQVSALFAVVDNTLAIHRDRFTRVCYACGENYGKHRGFDAACPHPRCHELGQPFFIEGTKFQTQPNCCEAQLVTHCEDATGVQCGKRCDPGKSFCPEHYEE